MKKQLVIYGAGGFARELAWQIQSCGTGERAYELACFIDDKVEAQGREINGVIVLGLDEARRRFPAAGVVGGVGDPSLRQLLAQKGIAAGFGAGTFVHTRAEVSPWVSIGEGTVICVGSVLTANITLGKHVQIGPSCRLGHDARVGDASTLSPGVTVSNWAHIGQRVFVGPGAVIINGTPDEPLTIGDDAVIGTGAVVTEPVASGQAFGGPAFH